MTNYERIKNMSIEEMAEFLMSFTIKLWTGDMPINVKKWLESEVTDEKM